MNSLNEQDVAARNLPYCTFIQDLHGSVMNESSSSVIVKKGETLLGPVRVQQRGDNTNGDALKRAWFLRSGE
jgi:hypothetical protein